MIFQFGRKAQGKQALASEFTYFQRVLAVLAQRAKFGETGKGRLRVVCACQQAWTAAGNAKVAVARRGAGAEGAEKHVGKVTND